MSENPLSAKVALITGAARRIGAEIARTLHGAGMRIVLHYHQSQDEAQGLCASLNQIRPHSAALVAADLTHFDQLAAFVHQAQAIWGRLDCLINNASIFYKTPLLSATTAAWDDLFATNLKAPFFLSQLAAPYLAASKGSIINITDIHAETPLQEYSIYCLTKAGLLMLTRQLAKELAPDIRVNAIAPGNIMWPEGENSLSAMQKQKIVSQIPLAHEGAAEDIALAALFFMRDASFVSGQVLNVDGGRSIG